jgi:hypothetical protein
MDSDLQAIFDDDDLGLLEVQQKEAAMTADERLIASFLEIVEFVDRNGRQPAPSSNVAEYQLFSRLMSIRKDPAKIEKVQDLDTHGLLAPSNEPQTLDDILSDDDLGLLDDDQDILSEKNLPSKHDMPGYVARQKPSKDFPLYEQKFINCHRDLTAGRRTLIPYKTEQIEKDHFYILKGVLIYIAEMEEKQKSKAKMNARLRVIYENGTESDILIRSLARSLKREGYRVSDIKELPLHFKDIEEDDQVNGYIYILSSLSVDQEVAAIRNLYKIGFSTGTVEQRIKNAAQDPTYLMAPVKIEATYKCYNMSPQKFEHLLHRFFSKARLDLEITDKLKEQYVPDEWFVAPLAVIDQAIQLIISGEVIHYSYDHRIERIVPRTKI